jgi:hypothetical protein
MQKNRKTKNKKLYGENIVKTNVWDRKAQMRVVARERLNGISVLKTETTDFLMKGQHSKRDDNYLSNAEENQE